MKRTDLERVLVALKHLSTLEEHRLRGPLTDQLIFDAICLRLASAIEEADQISPELLTQEFGDAWRDIRGMRNAIAHNYVFIDSLTVAMTVEHDIAKFGEGLHSMRRALEPG